MKIENYKLKIITSLLFILAFLLVIIQHNKNHYPISNATVKQPNNDELWAYYNKAQNFTGNDLVINQQKASFLAVGDIMLSRNVAGTIKKANDPLLPFSQMTSVLKSTDFNFGNLESPFSGKDAFNPTGSMVFNAPRDTIKGLVENKFKILNLANNHALDQGEAGLEYTLKYLDEKNIKPVGAGLTMEDAWNPAIMEQSGIKLCFFGASYASVNDSGKTTNNFVARVEDLDLLKTNIQKLKPTCDFIAASMHAGTEYTTKPNAGQIAFARAAIDSGADMVIGHHPHWVQEIEKYNGKYIFYSLGNFIFDQMWSQETREGLVIKIQVSKNQEPKLQGPRVPAALDSVELIPIIIENYSTPRLADETESKKILEKIGQTEKILK